MMLLDNLGLQENLKLYQVIADRLLDRLSCIRCIPKRILEFGVFNLYITKQLTNIYTNSELYSLLCDQYLNYDQNLNIDFFNKSNNFRASFKNLPLLDNSMDLILSNLTINCNEPSNNVKLYFKEMYRVTNNNGIILFTILNKHSNKDLNKDSDLTKTFNQKTLDQVDNKILIDIGNFLLLSEFCDPVIDREIINFRHKKHLIAIEIIYGHAVGKKLVKAPIELEVC
jgi:SAM-dependent methyltransferase